MPKLEGYRPADMSESNMIPEGNYHLRCSKVTYYPFKPADPTKPISEENKDKSPYLNVDWVVMDGQHTGRHVFDFVSLAKGEDWKMRKMCDATGKPEDWEVDTDEFVDNEVDAVVGKQPGKKGYPDKNYIKKFIVEGEREAL